MSRCHKSTRWSRGAAALLAALFASGVAIAQSVDLSPMQGGAIVLVFDGIKKASREGFATREWSKMAEIYPEGTFECWHASGENHRYASLSMEAIPEKAWYEVTPLPGGYVLDNL